MRRRSLGTMILAGVVMVSTRGFWRVWRLRRRLVEFGRFLGRLIRRLCCAVVENRAECPRRFRGQSARV